MEINKSRHDALTDSIRVSAPSIAINLFDDKVRHCGVLEACSGKVEINIDYLPTMVDQNSTREMLVQMISEAVDTAFIRTPEVFDPHSS